MLRNISALTVAFILSLSCPASRATPPEEAKAADPSEKPTPEIQLQVLQSEVLGQLATTFPQSFTEEQLKERAAEAKQAHKTAPVATGNTSEQYDAVIQIGHYPRTKGKTGTEGTHVTEQEIASLIAVGLYNDLITREVDKKKLKVLLIPADNYSKPLKTRIFISFHGDSSDTPCSVGPSVGYKDDGEALGMHMMAATLAITLGIDPKKFMEDNYTVNLSGYYSYKDMTATMFRGVLEMSELTCLDQEKVLLERAPALSANISTALQFALRQPK